VAYSAAANAWRVLPPAPIASRRVPAFAFTGTELLIWGGISLAGIPLDDGAAYQPETNTWRPLPEAPLPPGAGVTGAWTGEEWLLVDAGVGVASGEGAAYDPTADSWRPIAQAPTPAGWAGMATWTGHELIIIRLANEGPSGGARYDPSSDTWRPIAPNPELTIQTFPYTIWTGEEILVVRDAIESAAGLEDLAAGFAYNPTTDAWRRTAAPPDQRAFKEPVWTSEEAIFYGSGGDPNWAYAPGSDEWRRLPAVPDRHREFWSSVWTGRDVIIWGGSNPGLGETSPDGVAYRVE
jgi:hypothetical protein